MKHLFLLPVLLAFSGMFVARAGVTLDWVKVGDSGNAADVTGFGAVGYDYWISRNETTVAQYAEFLNAVAKSDPYKLYNTNMQSVSYVASIARTGPDGDYGYAVIPGSGDKPVTFVSWFDAARFCNWLHNGQGSGGTETGAYTLNGAMSGVHLANPGARYWIPTEDEWYKAAYYDAAKNGGTGGYWTIPNRSDTAAGNTIGVPGALNYHDGDYVGYPSMALTDVGAYGEASRSYYGTNDQGGNVYEWNDAVIDGLYRGIRGGAWNKSPVLDLESSRRYDDAPGTETIVYGFRVAAVPEPGVFTLTAFAVGLALLRRWKGKVNA